MSDDTAASKTPAKPESKGASETTSATSSASSSTEKVTSGAASAGGASAVHYGFFSNVKTPAYRNGWDSIWGGSGKTSSTEGSKTAKTAKAGEEPSAKPAKRSRRAPARPSKPKPPVTVELSLDDLPDEVRRGLVEAAKAKLGRSRASYDRREKAGAVSWKIACDIRR